MLGKTRREHPARPARRGSRPASRSTTWRGTRSTSGSRPRICPHPDNRVTVDRDGRIHLAKTYHNTEPHQRLLGKLKGAARARWAATSRDPALVGARPADPARRRSPTSAAPSASATTRRRRRSTCNCKAHDARQPLRRRHELLPVVERREPGADGDGERAAGRRPPARAARRAASRPSHRGTTPRAEEVRVMKTVATRSPAASARVSSPASPARRR